MTMSDPQGGPALADGILAPVRSGDRIFQLDMLRGWAVLGILAVNAMAFAWPLAAETAPGDPFGHVGTDAWGDWVVDVFFQDKFRTLFTMLFGVSVFLVGGERENKDRGRLLRRRLMWLGVFGIIHGAAIWYGDILLHYAYCGLLMLLVRSWGAKRLLWVGGAISVVWMLFATVGPLLMGALGPEFSSNIAANTPTVTMQQIEVAVAAYKVSPVAPWIQNLKAWVTLAGMSVFLIPVTVPLMMIGLGLFKSGFLIGRAPTLLYAVFAMLAAAILATDGWASQPGLDPASLPIGGLDSAAGGMAPLITVGYISMLMMASRFGLRLVTDRLVPVGQMAFTNYLTQSIIMASLFYLPLGPGWIGTMGPGTLWPIVIGIWAMQLVWSPLWLSRFSMGPLEWLWRSLTYGRAVPLTR